jgi:hypothetical protein
VLAICNLKIFPHRQLTEHAWHLELAAHTGTGYLIILKIAELRAFINDGTSGWSSFATDQIKRGCLSSTVRTD